MKRPVQMPASNIEPHDSQSEKREAGCAAPYGSAVPLIEKQIARLKTHRQMWKRSGTLNALPSDGQMQIIVEDLEQAVKILTWPKCLYCNNPERGGNRPGAALCESCWNDGPARP